MSPTLRPSVAEEGEGHVVAVIASDALKERSGYERFLLEHVPPMRAAKGNRAVYILKAASDEVFIISVWDSAANLADCRRARICPSASGIGDLEVLFESRQD
jgi:heme-degrading monooxygenase HmoA